MRADQKSVDTYPQVQVACHAVAGQIATAFAHLVPKFAASGFRALTTPTRGDDSGTVGNSAAALRYADGSGACGSGGGDMAAVGARCAAQLCGTVFLSDAWPEVRMHRASAGRMFHGALARRMLALGLAPKPTRAALQPRA